MVDGRYTTREVAEILGVTEAAVRKLIQRERLQAEYFGRDRLITQAQLDAYLKNRRAPGWPKGKPRKTG